MKKSSLFGILAALALSLSAPLIAHDGDSDHAAAHEKGEGEHKDAQKTEKKAAKKSGKKHAAKAHKAEGNHDAK